MHRHSFLTLLRLMPLAAVIFCGCGKGPPANVAPVQEISASAAAVSEGTPIEYSATDWPGWRGPRGDGISGDSEVPTSWSSSTNIVWSVPVPGRGHSSPVVVGDQVIVATALPDQQQQIVMAFDRGTGKAGWQSVVHEGGFPDAKDVHHKSTHANGTVACDGHSVFAAFLNGGQIYVTAISLAGEKIWQKPAGSFSPKFGYAPSPVLYKSLVIVAADNWGSGFIAALDRATGEIVWRKQRPAVSTYSSPLVATIDGKDQLVISGCNQVTSFNPATGEQLWECSATAEATCGTPVTDGKLVFASGGYPERQTVAVRADGSGQIVWSDSTKFYEPSMVVVDDMLVGVSDEGIAYCWSTSTGEQHWRHRLSGGFSASPIVCHGTVFVPNLSGETFVFRPTKQGPGNVTTNKLGDDAYASMAVSDGALFLRVGEGNGPGRTEKLVCIRSTISN